MSTTTFSILNNKSSLSELTESSVINRQFTQLQYDGWELAGSSKPYFIDFEFLKRNGYHHPDDDKSHCGKWVYFGCQNVKKHKLENQVNLPSNSVNPVFIKPTKINCNRLRCSECYTRASYFSSVKISKRIREFQNTEEYYNLNSRSRDLSIPIHVIVSPNLQINDTYISIRKRVVKLLEKVGVIGGCLVVHHFRCEDRKYTKNGLHFHCIGYARNNLVDGQEVKRQFEKENIIVKNLGKRISVRKTASYLLQHCTVNKKYHSITWFGKLSYSQLKNPGPSMLDKEDSEKIRCCPICQERLVRLEYVGTDRPPTDIVMGKPEDWKTAPENPYSSMSRN
jgi:hypothetical protein